MKLRASYLIVIGAVSLCGCAWSPSAGTSGALGAALGGVGGGAATHGNPVAVGAGSVVGAVVGYTTASSKQRAYQQGVDDGYLQGSSDAIKRLYWAKQHLEEPHRDVDSAAAILEAVAGPSQIGNESEGRRQSP